MIVGAVVGIDRTANLFPIPIIVANLTTVVLSARLRAMTCGQLVRMSFVACIVLMIFYGIVGIAFRPEDQIPKFGNSLLVVAFTFCIYVVIGAVLGTALGFSYWGCQQLLLKISGGRRGLSITDSKGDGREKLDSD